MKTPRTLRWIALLNLGCGALDLVATAIMLLVLFVGKRPPPALAPMTLFLGLFLTATIVIAASLIYSAVVYLKQPDQESALTLVANTGVIIWFATESFLQAIGAHRVLGSGAFVVSLVVPFLAYRLLLRPAVLRAFRDEHGAV